MKKYQRPRGTLDLLPDYLEKWSYVENVWIKIVKRYNFQKIVTPIFENTDLFARTAGESSDIVTKEMYTFLDKGGRSLTLRPEGTAAVVRAYFENQLYTQMQPVKLFYLMPMFRYERPQAGRFRQHHQYGVECIGERSPYIDTQVMSLFMDFYNELGVVEPIIWLNSLGCEECRPAYKQMLVNYLKDNSDKLCKQCNLRLEKNPLRVLDCKVDECHNYIDSAPLIKDNLCVDCNEDFEQVKSLLDMQQVNYVISPMLVRGLDYYNRTVFEVAAKGVSSKDVIAGGGRYDSLIKEVGGVDSSAFGAGAGMERLIETLEMQGVNIPIKKDRKIAVITLNEEHNSFSYKFCQQLRDANLTAECFFNVKKIGNLLSKLGALSYCYAVILGEDEISNGVVLVKNLNSRKQRSFSINDIDNMINTFRFDTDPSYG